MVYFYCRSVQAANETNRGRRCFFTGNYLSISFSTAARAATSSSLSQQVNKVSGCESETKNWEGKRQQFLGGAVQETAEAASRGFVARGSTGKS